MHRRAKSKPVSLGGGWELAVVGEAGDSSRIPGAPDGMEDYGTKPE